MSNKPDKPLTLEDYLTREEFRARFHVEKGNVQRHYCTLFGFWRTCRQNLCRRARGCRGNSDQCLKQSADRVDRHERFVARQKLLQATPRNLAAPERAARDIMAGDSWNLRATDIPRGWTRAGKRRPSRNRRGPAR